MDGQMTIEQHYVPRFYMKNFAVVKKKKKDIKAFISFYQFNKRLYKNNIPTKSICYKNNFYGEDGVIEKELAEKEKKWAKTINRIVECPQKELNLDEIENLKEFGVYQFLRTVAMLNHGKSMMSSLLITHFMNQSPELDKGIVADLVNQKIDKETEASMMVEMCDDLVKELNDLAVGIVKFTTLHKLITSDMPVIITNPFSIGKAGVANVGTVMMYPISLDTLVIIYDNKVYSSCCKFMISDNEQDVINLNKYQVISAENMIMSIDEQTLSDVVVQDDVIQKRTDFIEKEKIESSYDGKGTLFAMKSRSIKYEFPISLFDLPRNIRKIPIVCREVFHRKYDYELRLSLLCRVYRLPDLLKSNQDFPQSEIHKRIDGYKKLLNFMDDYWEVPMSERTITPELMYQLKNVPAKFFKLNGE